MNDKLKQRLVGAAVLFSLAVIFIPMILDGGRRDELAGLDGAIPPERDYQFEPLDIPLRDMPPPQERPAIVEQVEPTPEPAEPDEPAKPAEPEKPAEPAKVAESKPKPAPTKTPEPPAPTTASKTTTPAPAAEEATPRGWAVQVGSFSSSDNAIGLRNKLRKEGFSAFVEKLTMDSKLVYRVRVGPMRKREEADAALARIKSRLKLDGMVVGHPS